jgi:hypothetical protein
MFKRLMLLLCALCGVAQAQNLGPANLAGLLYASNFAQWSVPQGDQGAFTWSNSDICKVHSAGATFYAFAVGVPVQIVDTGNPAHDETVTPTIVNIGTSGCSISVHPTYTHNSFYFTSATAGLNEALVFAGSQNYQVVVTPDFTRLGGTTANITGAPGNSNVTILDERSSVIIPYLWSGSVYVANPFASGGNISPANQYALPFYSTSGSGSALGGSNIFTDSTHTNLSLVGYDLLNNPNLFTGANNFFNQANINGCNPSTEYAAINPELFVSTPVEGCVTSATATSQELIGIQGFASSEGGTSSGGQAVGGQLQGRILGSTGYAFGAAIIAGATSSLTSGGTIVGEEVDLSPESATTSFTSGVGIQVIGGTFYTCSGCYGTWPFTGITIGTNPSGSAQAGTAQYFKQGMNFSQGSFGPSSTIFTIGAQGTATSGTNFNAPVLMSYQESFSDGTTTHVEQWTEKGILSSATAVNPSWDQLLFDNGGGPSGSVHHVAADYLDNVDIGFYVNGGANTFSRIIPLGTCGSGDCIFALPNESGQVTAASYTSSVTPVNGDCVGWTVNGSNTPTLNDATLPCITSLQVNGTPVVSSGGAYNFVQGSNITLTPSGNQITITGSNTAATAFSALTAANNTNAGPFEFSAGQFLEATAGTASTPAIESTCVPYEGTDANSLGCLDLTSGSAASITTLNTAGTYFTIRQPTGGTSDLFNYFTGTTSEVKATSAGNLTANGTIQGATFTTSGGTGAISLANPFNSASSSTCFAPGALRFIGTYWTGSASAQNTSTLTPTCTAGTNGAETLTLANSGSTGPFTFAVSGSETVSGSLSVPTLDLGSSGTLGAAVFGNATSGTVTLEPVTGALGTVTASLPANTGTVAETNLAQTFSAVQTISATNGLVLSAMTGTNCLEEVSGVVTSTGLACGSGGSSTLNGITAATAAQAGINNGNNSIQWNWSLTGTENLYGFTFSENSASSAVGNPLGLVNISTLSGSTLVPLTVQGSPTGSQTLPALNILPVWNTTGNVTGALTVSITDTNSGSGSLALSILRNAANLLSVDKSGNGTFGGKVTASSFASSDTADNSAFTFATGSSGDSTCPAAAGGTSYLCTKNSGIAASINGAAYTPIGFGLTNPLGTPTYTAGTNVSSVACASGYTCTNTRGELTIVGGTATTGTIATLNFSATLATAPGLCTVTQEGGTTLFGIGHGVPSTSSFTITAGVSVAASTLTVDYTCLP